MNRIKQIWDDTPRELRLFIFASIALGLSYSLYDSIFSNFVNETYHMSAQQRTLLEFPRELPGLLVIVFASLLSFLPNRRMAAFAMVLGAFSVLMLGFFSKTMIFGVLWMFFYSIGNHLFMPLNTSIGMGLAKDGHTGKRLGQLNAVRNAATICGALIVSLGFRFFNFSFQTVFVLISVAFLVAFILFMRMMPGEKFNGRNYFRLHKAYNIYYLMSVLQGARKQIFITFGPWVLVTIFQKPTEIIATLLTIGGVIGILFQPFLGWAIDRYGEKKVMICEGFALIFVCLFYGFAKDLFGNEIAFFVICACFLLDQMLFSIQMARYTYLKKIANDPADVQPTITTGISIDHIFSIATAVVGGIVWERFGFQYVFLFGAVIAVGCLIVALRLKVPERTA